MPQSDGAVPKAIKAKYVLKSFVNVENPIEESAILNKVYTYGRELHPQSFFIDYMGYVPIPGGSHGDYESIATLSQLLETFEPMVHDAEWNTIRESFRPEMWNLIKPRSCVNWLFSYYRGCQRHYRKELAIMYDVFTGCKDWGAHRRDLEVITAPGPIVN